MKKNMLIILASTSLISLNLWAQAERVIVQLRDAAQDSFWYPATDKIRFGESGSTAFMGVDWEKAEGSFYGDLKLNLGVGFASYRNMIDLDIDGYKKLQIPVVGDGREYKILIKDENAMNSEKAYSYQAEFKTVKNKKQKISLKLKDFKPVFRGQADYSLPDLDLSQIRELGLQINDGKSGPYKLEFKEWTVLK